MSSGRARSALSESLLGRISQHRQAVESQEQPQTVSLDIASSSRGSGEASFEGRTPVEHLNTPFYGSPWPHLLRAGQAGSFPQARPPSTCFIIMLQHQAVHRSFKGLGCCLRQHYFQVATKATHSSRLGVMAGQGCKSFGACEGCHGEIPRAGHRRCVYS